MIASNKHDRPEMRREESLNDKIVQIDECKNSTNDKYILQMNVKIVQMIKYLYWLFFILF
jgi:hypothetical protein